jgi:hypothetical protein
LAVPRDFPNWYFILWVAGGVFLAAALVFYIRRYNERKKMHIAAFALFAAAFIYLMFAVVALQPLWMIIEATGLLLFLLFVWMAYRYSFWFLCLGWLLHVVWDAGVHPAQVAPYVPAWYAWLCMGFDVVIAVYVAIVLLRSPTQNS